MTETSRLPEKIVPLELATDAGKIEIYARLTADFNPIHLDADFAAQTMFGRPIIHGTMALNLVLEAIRRTLAPDHACGRVDIRFVKPSPVGETIHAGGRLADAKKGLYEVFVETADGVRTLEGTIVARKLA